MSIKFKDILTEKLLDEAIKADDFANQCETILSSLEKLVKKMPNKGSSEDQSQKVVLVNLIQKMYQAINGLEDSDFIK